MENASKALIMAASVLVGILIISFAAFLYSTYFNFAKEVVEKNELNQIKEFNAQFTKYKGVTTIYEIVSLANLAKENNIKYEINGNDFRNYEYNENTFYIRIDLKIGNKEQTNIERKSQEELIATIKQYSLNTENEVVDFKCTECKISDITKRVYYMKFEQEKK